ncbi:MAG TPA: MFS transporter [Steroidobacteraceae bacterium]|nr:MFS transporter [Steroidobacteraceae bacterium]
MNELLRRLVDLREGEAPGLLASFATFLCMFASYAILRPVRETMGLVSGVKHLPDLFWAVFIVMLLLQPLYGWLTSRLPRTVFLPWVYGFFAANLLGFYLWFRLQVDHTWIARTYFVWVSVFNLFVVAVFWSLMADVFTREQAGRMFGFIAAGASTGALIGVFVDEYLAVPLGTINLLPISAALLGVSLLFMRRVIRWQRAQAAAGVKRGADAERPLGGGVWAAFVEVVRSPYLLGIALFVMLVTWVTTLLYLEQQAYVAKVFTVRDEQTRFFATIDIWVQLGALLIQLFVFGRLFERLGLRAMLMSVPIVMVVAYSIYALAPGFMVAVVALIVRRVGDYSITRPCRDSLFTVVSREEKYKAKSLIDTCVYRGGDALSAQLYRGITAGLGGGPSSVGWLGAGISALWAVLAFYLGAALERARPAAEAQARASL